MGAHWPGFLLFTALALVITPLVFRRAGVYARYWRYASVEELLLLVGAVTTAVVLVGAISLVVVRFLPGDPPLPRSIPLPKHRGIYPRGRPDGISVSPLLCVSTSPPGQTQQHGTQSRLVSTVGGLLRLSASPFLPFSASPFPRFSSSPLAAVSNTAKTSSSPTAPTSAAQTAGHRRVSPSHGHAAVQRAGRRGAASRGTLRHNDQMDCPDMTLVIPPHCHSWYLSYGIT